MTQPDRAAPAFAAALPAALDLEHADALRAQLSETRPGALDGAAVERADTAGLQLLACLLRSQTGWSVAQPSDPLRGAAQRLGLTAALGFDPIDGVAQA